MVYDIFYRTCGMSVERIKEIIAWAHENGLSTRVTMLNARKSLGRVDSDKDFNEVFDLIDERCGDFFRIILRKEMNLFAILTDELFIDDIIEIGIRGIDVGPNEFFISILVDKKYIGELLGRYGLEKIM